MPLSDPATLGEALAAEAMTHRAVVGPGWPAEADVVLAPARAEVRRLALGRPSGVSRLFVPADTGHPASAKLRAMLLVELVRWEGADDPDALAGTAFALDVPEAAPDPGRPVSAVVMAAAREAFAEIQGLVESLTLPDRRGLAALAAVINVDAGQYPIAGDLRELAAAFRAGEQSWRRFPYYRQRYGGHGRRFIWSDSAWLASLPGRRRSDAWHQVDWVARLLAARGMPQWMTEDHLRHLHDELCRACPERSDRYGVLAEGERLLRDGRLRVLGDAALGALAADFAAAVGPELAGRWPDAGELLVAAVADERQGVDAAVRQVESFYADPARFPDRWITAVRELVRRARQA